MTIPANTQQAAAPWGAEAVYVCFGTEGGPYTGVSASSGLPVNIVAGGGGIGGNVAAGLTGSAVPADADYSGLNVGGNLRGQTGVNPSGSVYAAQTDLASVGGASFALGQQLAAASIPVVLTAAQLSTLTPLSTVAVTGTFWQATQPVSLASLPALVAGTALVGKVGIDQTTVGTTNAVSIAQVGSTSVVTSIAGALGVGGDTASGSADAGNPLKIGGVAHTAAPMATTDGKRVNLIADKVGKLIAVAAIRELKGVQKTTITSSTSETTIVSAVASTFLDLYGLIIANTSGTACNVTIKDATSGTTRALFAVPAGETRGFMLPADSAIPQASVNNNWTATCSASVASIEITALYVQNI